MSRKKVEYDKFQCPKCDNFTVIMKDLATEVICTKCQLQEEKV